MEWFREMLQEHVSYPKLDFDIRISNDVFEELNSFIRFKDADLIVMLEREKLSLYSRWFHRDLVKRMEFHTTIPLLSFNERFLEFSPGFRTVHQRV